MPTATKPMRPKVKQMPKPKAKSTLEYLQQAVQDLDKVRSNAQHQARANIDAAVNRIRDVATELRARAAEPARELEERLEQVSEDGRRELGRMIIQAQRNPEALTELASEIRRRKRQLSASA